MLEIQQSPPPPQSDAQGRHKLVKRMGPTYFSLRRRIVRTKVIF